MSLHRTLNHSLSCHPSKYNHLAFPSTRVATKFCQADFEPNETAWEKLLYLISE